MNTFFTSDTHFGHANIIEYCNRPWKTVEEMNEGLIHNWNETVGPRDEVYHLGDFAMGGRQPKEFTRRLNGRIHLIRGNHDREVDGQGFASVHPMWELKMHGQKIVLCHFPFYTWNGSHHGSWHLFGHVHGTVKFDDKLCADAGVDANSYRPISFDEVSELMASKKWVRPADDRHNKKGGL